jgi:hypothetical protein
LENWQFFETRIAQQRSLYLKMSKPAASVPKTSWASLAKANASKPAPPAPVTQEVKKPQKPKQAQYKPYSSNKGGKPKKDLPYDRSTPNYPPQKTSVVANVKEVMSALQDQHKYIYPMFLKRLV